LGDFYKERVLRKLKSFEKQLKTVCTTDKHQFYTHAAFNNLDAELNSMARKEGLDLIAMGTQGATGAREILFGTHAVQVLHKAEVPVLVVPSAAQPDELKQVLFPTDYAPDYTRLNLKALDRILHRSAATVHILHAYSEADERPKRKTDKELLAEVLKAYPHEWHEIGQKGVIAAIDEFAGKQEVDLLVMVRNQHTVLERLLVTPVIDQIGFHTAIPFLVIPPENAS
jgi:nucleotide-binding universal stress UspA family protein